MHRLEHLTSKAACLAAVESVQSDISLEVAVFTANMRYVSQRQISMLRHMIDDAPHTAGSSQSDVPKKWLLLLHFMPGAAVGDAYPALFLYGWNFWFLDSCTGGTAQQEMLHMPSWAAAATAVFNGRAFAPRQLLGEAHLVTSCYMHAVWGSLDEVSPRCCIRSSSFLVLSEREKRGRDIGALSPHVRVAPLKQARISSSFISYT